MRQSNIIPSLVSRIDLGRSKVSELKPCIQLVKEESGANHSIIITNALIVQSLSKEEMDSGGLNPMERNDFCVKERLIYKGCITENIPFVNRCKGLWRELSQCLDSEVLHDMKEFEREKRLNRRERLLRERAAQLH